MLSEARHSVEVELGMGYETGRQGGKGPRPEGSACHTEWDFLTEQVTEQVRRACEVTVAPVD